MASNHSTQPAVRRDAAKMVGIAVAMLADGAALVLFSAAVAVWIIVIMGA